MANVDIEKVVSPTFTHKFRIRKGDVAPFGNTELIYRCAWRYTHPEVKDEKEIDWIAIVGFISKEGKATTAITKIGTYKSGDEFSLTEGYATISASEAWNIMFLCEEVEACGETTLEERIEDVYLRLKKHLKYKTIGVSDLIYALSTEFNFDFPKQVKRHLETWNDGIPQPHLLEVFNSTASSNYGRLLEYNEATNLKVWWKKLEIPLTNLLPKHLRSRFKNEEIMFSKPTMELHYNALNNYVGKSECMNNQTIDLEDEDIGVYISKDYGWDKYIYLMMKKTYNTPTNDHVFTYLYKFEIYAFPISKKVKIERCKNTRLKDKKDAGFMGVEKAILAYYKNFYVPDDVKFVLEHECEFKLTNYVGSHSWDHDRLKGNWTLDFKPNYEEMITNGILIDKKKKEIDAIWTEINRQSNKHYIDAMNLDQKAEVIDNYKESIDVYDMIAKGEDIKICSKYVNERTVPTNFVDDDFEAMSVSKPKKNTMEICLKFKLTNHVFHLKKSNIIGFSIVKYGGVNDKEDGIRRKIYEAGRITYEAVVSIWFKYAKNTYNIYRFMSWHGPHEKPDLSDFDRVLNGTCREIEKKDRVSSYSKDEEHIESLRNKWITERIYVEDGSLKIDIEKDTSRGGVPFKTTIDKDNIIGFKFLKGDEGIGSPTGVRIMVNRTITETILRSEAIVEIKFLYEKEITTIKRFISWIDGKDKM